MMFGALLVPQHGPLKERAGKRHNSFLGTKFLPFAKKPGRELTGLILLTVAGSARPAIRLRRDHFTINDE